ncbi:glycosyltransferase [Desulfovibrio inopinatus]|uniref:glycosyltransferase n=1 Tax=Desulfovibrio inopinatus TaxID=102109 RepID=UPI0003F8B03C|nr:glycosyltransferase family 2 protein [Desulfovibrio inopinatus]
MIFGGLLVFSILLLVFYAIRMERSVRVLPHLIPYDEAIYGREPLFRLLQGKTVSVIIGAHNVEGNVARCIETVLESTFLDPEYFECIVIDDESTDGTYLELAEIARAKHDPRLRVMYGQPCPSGEIWIGKSWACFQAVRQARGDYILFLDAGMQLQPGSLESALVALVHQDAGLLSFFPENDMTNVAAKIVEPAITIAHLASPWLAATHNPKSAAAFAGGGFMLFTRDAYWTSGGYAGVGTVAQEDMELARKVKKAGFSVVIGLGPEMAKHSMPSGFTEMGESYARNFVCAFGHNTAFALVSAVILVMTFCLPWLGVIFGISELINGMYDIGTLQLGLATAGIGLQYCLRLRVEQLLHVPMTCWWAMGIAGFVLAAFDVISALKHGLDVLTWKDIPLPKER